MCAKILRCNFFFNMLMVKFFFFNKRWGGLGGSHVWGVNRDQNIFQYTGAGGWNHIDGKLVEISCAADGSVYGVNVHDQIYQYNGHGGWNLIPGSLVQISVAHRNLIWGVNRNQQIFWCDASHQWQGVSCARVF